MSSILTHSAVKAARPRLLVMVWAPHEGRTAMFAKRLNAPLYNVHYLLYKRPYIAPFKYVLQAVKTWAILLRERPRVVYVTNPPVFAPLCVWLWSLLTGTKLIIDTHPPSLYSRRWGWTLPLQRFLIRRALLNVTDQARFADMFAGWGARAVVLPNPPKHPPTNLKPGASVGTPNGTSAEQAFTFEIAVVNTFAVDEPLDIILEAARTLPYVHFSIMGDLKLAPAGVVENAPSNVTFTDYLRGDDYWAALQRANAVMVLTTYPYSLLGGAQDAVALDKPLLLSDQPALREYFTAGTVFIPNTADGIAAGARQLQRDEAHLSAEIRQLAAQQESAWQARFAELLSTIEQA
jgi:glycosyltransferase involved in cell wall biosynthesis